MRQKTDSEIIARTHNTTRFFVEHRQLALVLLVATLIWGWYGYSHMPKRKDPSIPVRVGVAICPWPGATAEQVEQLVTRPIEDAVSQNANLQKPSASDFAVQSLSFPGLSIVYVQLNENLQDTRKQFSDIDLRLEGVSTVLPKEAGPIQFNGDLGDTAAVMLTVASPKVGEVELAVRARAVQTAIEHARAGLPDAGQRTAMVSSFPYSVSADLMRRELQVLQETARNENVISDVRWLEGPGFVGIDFRTSLDDKSLLAYEQRLLAQKLHYSEIHPESWQSALVHNPEQTASVLAAVAGDKYTYAELDADTDLIARNLQTVEQVSKTGRSGVLPETIYLDYSQERLAAYGVKPSDLRTVLNARNVTASGGVLEVGGQNVNIAPSGRFQTAEAIGDVVIGATPSGSPVYLRDLVQISRAYQTPPRFLNYLTWKDEKGNWQRSRAVTIAVQMREGEQIGRFGDNISGKLAAVKRYLPDDLIIAHTSDQPLQVKESIDLLTYTLYEAVLLVVLVSWIGFWNWRSALLMAVSIPITLAMTLGMIQVLRIDLQQVSIATLILALGLLVDDPVVAGDSIVRALTAGLPRTVAEWLGPTRLARAILFATLTMIAAYLPFLMLKGTPGTFLYSLPVVMTCALVASRIVSMTFVPVVGHYLLRAPKRPGKTIEEKRTSGITGLYARLAKLAIRHRWKVLGASAVFLAMGGLMFTQLKTAFFPEDVQYWSYVEVWLPNGSSLMATDDVTRQVETVVRQTAARYAQDHPAAPQKSGQLLRYMTSFVGGGGPRFWFSVGSQLQQTNYAQVLIELSSKNVTPLLVPELQAALDRAITGARCDVRQLQTSPVAYPVEIRVSAQADLGARDEAADIQNLRAVASKVENIVRSSAYAARVRQDWWNPEPLITLDVNADRANLAGVSNYDIAQSLDSSISGQTVTALRQGDKQIPVVARAFMQEHAQISDVNHLYVYSSQQSTKVPLSQFATTRIATQEGRIIRLERFHTISVQGFPVAGSLASDVTRDIMPKINELRRSLPAGYRIEIGGEYDQQRTGFLNVTVVLTVSVVAIFLVLLAQFKNAVEPLLVLAATPFGIAGAIIALAAMHVPFGFMAFLGIASLIGVIVSHVIVLFDFIEGAHARGDDLESALIDAGIQRLRPVAITVGATVIALVPLALHGGPLWQPLCYAQIWGLSLATLVTLLLVPVLYSVFVLDLKMIRWKARGPRPPAIESKPVSPVTTAQDKPVGELVEH